MGSLFASAHAMEALAALEQREAGMGLSDVAGALQISASSAQVALRLLLSERLVVLDGRSYRLADDDASALLDVASRRPGGGRLIDRALRANPAVEFAGRDIEGLLLVTRWDAEPRDEVRLGRTLRRLPGGAPVDLLGHEDVRDRLLDSSLLRERAARCELIVGNVARSFPDPFSHGSSDARALADLSPALRRPSRAALARLARRFGLREIRVFGSAVHSDFRADSDVDVMVRRQSGRRRTLETELALRRELESLFDRDVDVVDASAVRADVRGRAETEGVVLYGRA